jgi:hypothetical protein
MSLRKTSDPTVDAMADSKDVILPYLKEVWLEWAVTVSPSVISLKQI